MVCSGFIYLGFHGKKFIVFHGELSELLRKEKNVTKLPVHTYGERERELGKSEDGQLLTLKKFQNLITTFRSKTFFSYNNFQ